MHDNEKWMKYLFKPDPKDAGDTDGRRTKGKRKRQRATKDKVRGVEGWHGAIYTLCLAAVRSHISGGIALH